MPCEVFGCTKVLARGLLANNLRAALLEARNRFRVLVDDKGKSVDALTSSLHKSGQCSGVGTATGETEPGDTDRHVVHRLNGVTGLLGPLAEQVGPGRSRRLVIGNSDDDVIEPAVRTATTLPGPIDADAVGMFGA